MTFPRNDQSTRKVFVQPSRDDQTAERIANKTITMAVGTNPSHKIKE